MSPRTILITNIILSHRSGTEVVVEQLADGLRRRGHRPVVFAPQLGPLAEEMRARGHFVIDKPAGSPFQPDIIHAHHTGPAMAAIAAHPDVPALFVCHDATSGFDAVPLHPRLRRIFAVDERCRARLIAEGIDVGAVQLLPNAVDLTRISRRALLPDRPTRAVVLTKQSAHLPALRAACASQNIELLEYGFGVGRIIDRPEDVFAEADLVFATARSALEASAAGAGVVVCDARGCAGFLTRANAENWLPYNLGAGILAHPCDEAQLIGAIANWSAVEAAAASELVRERFGMELSLDRLEEIYSEMLATELVLDPAAEASAVGNFIAGWVPHFNQQAPWRRLADTVASPPLGSPVDVLNISLTTLSERVVTLDASTNMLDHRLTALSEKVDVLNISLTTHSERVGALDASTNMLDHRLTALSEKVDVQNIGLTTLSERVGALDASTNMMDHRLTALSEKVDVLSAAVRGGSSVSMRLEAIVRGLWRRIVPLRFRGPLHRFRRRLIAALLR